MKKNILIQIFILFCLTINSQEQLTSFFDANIDKDSNPSDFITLNDKLLFIAENDSYGSELWVIEQNSGNAVLLKDINAGSNDGISHFYSSSSKSRRFKEHTAIMNNELYFIATDGTSDGDLWKTDGTSNGTQKVTTGINFNINYTNPQSTNLRIINVNNTLFFNIKINDMSEVWKSDGTNNGTVLVKDGIQASFNSDAQYRGKVNDLFIFSVRSVSTNTNELWRSDGTETGTYILIDNIGGNGTLGGTVGINPFIEFNNELYFIARDFSGSLFSEPGLDIGIVKTDGTIANTLPVQGLYGINELFDFSDTINVNDELYFSFYRLSNNEFALWKYDPVANNATTLIDLDSSQHFMTSNLISDGNNILFTGPSANGTALYTFDTSNPSINFIKDLEIALTPNFFDPSDLPIRIQQIRTNLFFLKQPTNVNNGNSEFSGWVTDLTEVNTIVINALSDDINPYSFNNNLFFSDSDMQNGNELWTSDGTEIGTTIFDNINEYPIAIEPSTQTDILNLNNINTVNGKIVFGASDDTNGFEPRSIDNSSNNLSLLADVNIGSDGSSPGFLSGYNVFNSDIYFVATNSNGSERLFKTNGNTGGTVELAGLPTGTATQFTNFIVNNGILYFTGRVGSTHYLFSTDGSNISTVKNFGSGINTFDMIKSNDNKLYLYNPSFSGSQLWVSDGTEFGTELLKTFTIYSGHLTSLNNEVYFSAQENFGEEIELWKSDGTPSGTFQLLDIGVGYSSEPDNLIALGSKIIFSAFTEEEGRELWVSDGTAAGTSLLKDINNSPLSSIAENPVIRGSNMIVLNNEVLFAALDGINGIELWKSDGTTNGTLLLKDINNGSLGSNPKELTRIENMVYFQAATENEGSELWKSDGTTSGTLMVTDNINNGPLGSVPLDFINIGNDLIFTAITPSNGRQIWRISNQILNTNDFNTKIEVILFPNPTSHILNIKTEAELSNLKIHDINGKLIYELESLLSNSHLDISNLNSGMYMITFSINGISSTKKFIKL